MSTGSVVTAPPAAWAAGATPVAAAPWERGGGGTEEAAIVPRRTVVGCGPSQQQQEERSRYILSYSDTGLPVLLPYNGAAGCFSGHLNAPFSGIPAASGAPSSFFSPVLPFPSGGPGQCFSAFSAGAAASALSPAPQCWGGFPYFSPAATATGGQRRGGVSTGTTIVAVTFKGGVVLGADTRTSAGSYVVNRAARKITPIHEKICVCRSGSAADTQALTQIVKLYLQQYAQELPRRSTAAERRRHQQREAAEEQQQDGGEGETKEGERGQQQQEKRREAAQEEEEERRKDAGAAGGGELSGAVAASAKKPREDSGSTGAGGGAAAGGGGTTAAGGGEKKKEEERGGPPSSSTEEEQAAVEDARSEPRVRAAATLFQSLCYEYKDTLTAGLIVAGYDAVEGSQIYSIPLGGALMPMKCTAGGSGSAFISAFMDAHFHPDMERAAAVDFVKKSVAHAISRDGASGGMIRIMVVTPRGLEEECVEGNRLPVRP